MIRVSVGAIDRIPPGEGREITVGNRSLVVFRPRAGGVYATQALCPHREGRLSEGLLGGTTLVCPLHGYRFDVTTGAPVGAGNTCEALRTYATHVVGGEVMIDVPE